MTPDRKASTRIEVRITEELKEALLDNLSTEGYPPVLKFPQNYLANLIIPYLTAIADNPILPIYVNAVVAGTETLPTSVNIFSSISEEEDDTPTIASLLKKEAE